MSQLLKTLAVQAALLSVTLGSLKHYGVVQMNPEFVENQTLRTIFVKSVALGEAVCLKAEQLYNEYRS